MPRWRIAAGSLAPLPAIAIVVLLHGRGIPSTLLLLVAVAFGYLFAGLTAGIAALVLAVFLYEMVGIPIRGAMPALSSEAIIFGAAFALTGSALIAVLGRLRAAAFRAERAREAAERRAWELGRRIELIGPMLDAAPIGFALVDAELRYQYVNSRLAEINGYPVAEHIGRRPSEVFGPELTEAIEAPIREVLRTGVPQSLVSESLTINGRERYLVRGRHPVRDARGQVVGVVVAVQDVTEQIALQRELIRTETEAANLRATAELAYKLEQAQRLAGFGSWEYDIATGRYTFSRQIGAILGVEERELGSMASVGARVHEDDLARVRAARDELLAEHTPFTLEYRLVRADGQVLDVLSTGEVYRDTSGQVTGLWGTIQDVTAQRAAERAAREAVRHAEQARAELEVEHQALQMFQRAMLPTELPRVAGLDLSAVYLSMAERIDIGGDWYDAFLLADGRLALAVGDVTGHDLRAATVMGQVRNAVRAYATEDPTPGTVLARVNTLLARLPDLDLVTMLFGVYDPETHELTWSNAGHPPPLLRHGDTVTTLEQGGGLLLGVLPGDEPYPEHRQRFAPGDTVLWFTDGIIDHRSTDPVVALRQLSAVFAGATGGVADLLNAVSTDMLADGPREDDVCLLALRRAVVVADPAAEPTAPPAAEPAVDPAAEPAESRGCMQGADIDTSVH
jgi:sigma-B regulation protein RsbU (phosphoserine phosphatase)